MPKYQSPNPNGRASLGVQLYTIIDTRDDGQLFCEPLTILDDKKGLQTGDIIRKIGGDDLSQMDESDFVKKVRMYRPGAVVELVVKRGDKMVTVKITLEEGVVKEFEEYSEEPFSNFFG